MDPRHAPTPHLTREDWRGHLRPQYREADQWYRHQLMRLGLLPPTAEFLLDYLFRERR